MRRKDIPWDGHPTVYSILVPCYEDQNLRDYEPKTLDAIRYASDPALLDHPDWRLGCDPKAARLRGRVGYAFTGIGAADREFWASCRMDRPRGRVPPYATGTNDSYFADEGAMVEWLCAESAED